ncbi:hypothetical protein CDL15_Pgr012597 [Punica granatum]|uniref:Uncharacterized protein n=1 Tax=Punica granatum TaxID=22663 RepID=A0A218XYR0_PUNGR|nr:hypothetical protein CDL15_Pgr012597 [Punica granatum]
MSPASTYKALTVEELRKKAVKRYRENSTAEDMGHVDDPTVLLQLALDMSGEAIQIEHIMEFCQRNNVRDGLIQYAQTKIQEFENEGMMCQARKFQHYLDVLGVQPYKAEQPEAAGVGCQVEVGSSLGKQRMISKKLSALDSEGKGRGKRVPSPW